LPFGFRADLSRLRPAVHDGQRDAMEGRIADRRAERPALDLPRPDRPTIREVTEARLREARSSVPQP
jgi:hypothetical protein